VARQAEKLGWSWAYWQFDGDFIVYDVKNDAWVEPIRRALLPAAATEKATPRDGHATE
jgi:endoglucanase